jgi:hypothetical protein
MLRDQKRRCLPRRDKNMKVPNKKDETHENKKGM